jgi:hypothetical protein
MFWTRKLPCTEKSGAVATCREMPIIPVNKVVDKEKNNWNRRAEEDERKKNLE